MDQLGEQRRALDDLDKVIELAPSQPHFFFARGMVHRRLGEHDNALADFARGEAMNKKEWQDAAVTLLGDEANALDCCGRLPEKFWTPGFEGRPAAVRRKSPKNYGESQRKPSPSDFDAIA